MNKSFYLKINSIFLYVYGIIGILGSIFLFLIIGLTNFQELITGMAADSSTSQAIFAYVIGTIFYLALFAGALFVARGLWKNKKWAGITHLVLLSLSILILIILTILKIELIFILIVPLILLILLLMGWKELD
jgi:hypothetical protein